jgi:hypothetical protein
MKNHGISTFSTIHQTTTLIILAVWTLVAQTYPDLCALFRVATTISTPYLHVGSKVKTNILVV